MELSEAVRSRRSIRKFKPSDITKGELIELLDCARLCQSGNNRQPWLFKVVTGKDKLDISKLLAKKAAEENVPWAKESASIIAETSTLIIIFKKKDERNNSADLLSIGAAMEHICLKAVDLGLGSVCIGDLRLIADEIIEKFSLNDLEFVISIAVGIPDENPPLRKRKTLKEITL